VGSGVLAACGMVVAMAAQTASHHQPPARYSDEGAIAMPEDRAGDSYAIYSRLMPGETFASMPADQASRWAIAAVTVSEVDRDPAVPPQGQLRPPEDNPQGFEEAVGDYEANKNVRVQLTRDAFQLSHPFALLSPEQLTALRGARTAPEVSSETQSNWSGYPGITYFSEVYFDSKHRAALVYMNDWCAHLCSAGTWVYLEKHGGQWVRRSGVVVPGA
jgi:hypothetical protein